MKTIVEGLMFCAFQELAFRGHREVDSKNRGNFLELLDLVSNHDSVMKIKNCMMGQECKAHHLSMFKGGWFLQHYSR